MDVLDDSALVDDDRAGDLADAECAADLALGVGELPEGDAALVDERADAFVHPGPVLVDADDDDVSPGEALGDALDLRHDGDARGAPGGPEVEHDDLAAERGQRDGLAGHGGALELGRGLADEGHLRAAGRGELEGLDTAHLGIGPKGELLWRDGLVGADLGKGVDDLGLADGSRDAGHVLAIGLGDHVGVGRGEVDSDLFEQAGAVIEPRGEWRVADAAHGGIGDAADARADSATAGLGARRGEGGVGAEEPGEVGPVRREQHRGGAVLEEEAEHEIAGRGGGQVGGRGGLHVLVQVGHDGPDGGAIGDDVEVVGVDVEAAGPLEDELEFAG